MLGGHVYPSVPFKDNHEACLMWHLENGVALSSERKLVTVSNEAIKIDHLGKSSFSVFNLPAGLRFNDDVYFFMSQRLLDTQMI